jgi:maleate cis-trans isomerase
MLEPPIEAIVVHTSSGEDAHREDALRDTGAVWRLLDGAAELKRVGVDAAMWACTSGSFVFGLEGAIAQARAIQDFLGKPVSSTSLAFVSAARAMGLRRIAIGATYPDDVASLFQQLLGDSGFETVHRGSLGIITGVEVGTLGWEAVLRLCTANDHPDAEAILMPDTALHTIAWVAALESHVHKPVLTANQVTIWEALRLAGALTPQEGLGRLFRESAVAAAR